LPIVKPITGPLHIAAFHQCILQLDFPIIYTTNCDRWLEIAFRSHPITTYRRFLIGFWLLDSVAVLALWAITFATGRSWEQGLFAYQNGNIPIFHLVAECLMALVTGVGFLGVIARRPWGRMLALLGVGMFTYSSINSLGWALHNAPGLAVPMLASLVGAALVLMDSRPREA
jgi:hypothetical protein